MARDRRSRWHPAAATADATAPAGATSPAPTRRSPLPLPSAARRPPRTSTRPRCWAARSGRGDAGSSAPCRRRRGNATANEGWGAAAHAPSRRRRMGEGPAVAFTTCRARLRRPARAAAWREGRRWVAAAARVRVRSVARAGGDASGHGSSENASEPFTYAARINCAFSVYFQP